MGALLEQTWEALLDFDRMAQIRSHLIRGDLKASDLTTDLHDEVLRSKAD